MSASLHYLRPAALVPVPSLAATPATPVTPAMVRRQAASIAALAADCLELEVHTWPKPGLVSDVDTGSHTDMDADTFRRSAAAIRPYLQQMAEAAADGAVLGTLQAIGLSAEASMLLATGGVNTHRGAIFGMGLLCAAAGARAAGLVDAATPLGEVVAQRWGFFLQDGAPAASRSHGQLASQRYGVGGARAEAALGFPTLYAIGLPALREGARLAAADPQPTEAARVHCCMSLIAALADTNLLHRGGLAGLRFAQRAAGEFLAAGSVGRPGWLEHATDLHRAFVARRLSPGGSADLLAMSLFVQAIEAGEL